MKGKKIFIQLFGSTITFTTVTTTTEMLKVDVRSIKTGCGTFSDTKLYENLENGTRFQVFHNQKASALKLNRAE